MSTFSHSEVDCSNSICDDEYEYTYEEDDSRENFADMDRLSESGRSSVGSHIKFVEREAVFDYVCKQIFRSAEALNLPFNITLILLRQFRWDHDALCNSYFEDAKKVLMTCRIGDSNNFHCSLEQKGSDQSRSSTCDICAHDVSDDEMYAIGCHHFFCKDCWARYIVSKIKEAECLSLRCMEASCCRPMSREVVERLITSEELKSYDRFIAQTIVDEHPDMLWCPSTTCGRVLIWHQSSRSADEVTCLCGSLFCMKCKRPPHQPATCAEMKDWDARGAGASESFSWLKNNTKDCPKCHSPIEKNGGCNHIYCKVCRHEFCWSCMGTWNNHTTSDHPGCHGYVADKTVSKEREDVERFGHYFLRYTVHLESEKIENMLLASIQEKIATMDDYAARRIQSSSLYNSSSSPRPADDSSSARGTRADRAISQESQMSQESQVSQTSVDSGLAELAINGSSPRRAMSPSTVSAPGKFPPPPPFPVIPALSLSANAAPDTNGEETAAAGATNNNTSASTVSTLRKALTPRLGFFRSSSKADLGAATTTATTTAAVASAAATVVNGVANVATAAAALTAGAPPITTSAPISNEVKIKPSDAAKKKSAFSLSLFWGIRKRRDRSGSTESTGVDADPNASAGGGNTHMERIGANGIPRLDLSGNGALALPRSLGSSLEGSPEGSPRSPRSPRCYGLVPGDTEYLLEAVRVLCDCRRVLKHTYIHAFYIKTEQERQMFEFLQLQLEMNTEELSNLLEHFWTKRHMIVNQTAAAEHRLALVLEGIHGVHHHGTIYSQEST